MQKTAPNWRANFALVGTRHDIDKGRLSIYTFSLCHKDDKARTASNGFCTPPDHVMEREISTPNIYSQFSEELRLRHHYTKIARHPFRFSDDGQTALSRNYLPFTSHESYVLAGIAEYLALGDLFSLGAKHVKFLDGGTFRIIDVLNALRFGAPRTGFSSKSLPEGLLVR